MEAEEVLDIDLNRMKKNIDSKICFFRTKTLFLHC